METELAKQRLAASLFLMEVETGWEQVWGRWGWGSGFLEGQSAVSGTSSDVNVGPVCLSGPTRPPGGVSPPSRGCGHRLPAPSEPRRPQFFTPARPWSPGCSEERGHTECRGSE